jgi:transaldolase
MKRGHRLRLLNAAFRNHLHWSQFIGGSVVISPPYECQKRFNASDVTVENVWTNQWIRGSCHAY